MNVETRPPSTEPVLFATRLLTALLDQPLSPAHYCILAVIHDAELKDIPCLSGEIPKRLRTSQTTAVSRIQELVDNQSGPLIHREYAGRKIFLSLTARGRKELRDIALRP